MGEIEKNNINIEKGSFLYLSEKDFIRANQMFDLGDYSACGRFCEQSVEKSLKAFIEKNGDITDVNLMHLHKPRRLYERCCDLGLGDFDKFTAAELALLSDYYFDTNYPGAAFFELNKKQAEDAIKIAQFVNKIIIEKLADRK